MELRHCLEHETVASVGYRELLSVGPDASIGETVALMQAHKVGCILIIDGKRLCGIVTERDVVKRVIGPNRPLGAPVSTVMTPEPVVTGERQPLAAVLSSMHAAGLRHLPVVNDSGEPVGTISVKRLAGYLADHFASVVYNLPPEPNKYPSAEEGA